MWNSINFTLNNLKLLTIFTIETWYIKFTSYLITREEVILCYSYMLVH